MAKASGLRSTRLIAVLLLAGLVVASVPVQATQAQRRLKWPNISGTWRLNEMLSTNWSYRMSGEVGSEVIITPLSFNAAGFDVTPSRTAETSLRARELLDATRRLEIFHERRVLTLNAIGGRFVVLARTFLIDAPAWKAFGPAGRGSSQAQWIGNRFVIETRAERGPQITETYEVSGGRLYLSVKIQKDQMSVPTFVLRIYDRVPV
jgi:hypothetical protein